MTTTEAIKERPLLFSPAMVRAILDGHKTMTRRVIRPQPVLVPASVYPVGCDLWATESGLGWNVGETPPPCYLDTCPHGQAGDRIWVRESLRLVGGAWTYGADEAPVMVAPADRAAMLVWAHHKEGSVQQARFMHRWACRLVLEITDLCVQRIQDIGAEDIIAEGAWPRDWTMVDGNERRAFVDLWDGINAKRGAGWDMNPWVWVISFRVVA